MSASPAQVNANRANAQQSNGPKTPQGVEACKFNALKFGLCAADIVIKGEDPEAYDALRKSYIETYAPANEIEAMMVERTVQCWWKLQRAERTEKVLTNELGDARFYDDAASRKWNNFTRYRNAIEKSWRYAHGELKQLIGMRQKNTAADLQRQSMLSFVASHIEEQNQQRERDLARIGSVLQMRKDTPAGAASKSSEGEADAKN